VYERHERQILVKYTWYAYGYTYPKMRVVAAVLHGTMRVVAAVLQRCWGVPTRPTTAKGRLAITVKGAVTYLGERGCNL
jgi:hypothetical protein